MVYFVKENGLDILCVSLQLPMLLIAAFPLVVFQKTKKTLKIRYCTIINLLHLKTMLLFFSKQICENSEISFAAIQWSHWKLVLPHLSRLLVLPCCAVELLSPAHACRVFRAK